MLTQTVFSTLHFSLSQSFLIYVIENDLYVVEACFLKI